MAVSLKSDLRTIWRLENQDGVGPYRSNNIDVVLFLPPGSDECPSPLADEKLSDIFWSLCGKGVKEWVFGFSDLGQYKAWFGDEDVQEILAAHQFSLNRYEIEPSFVHEGTNQCMFYRPAALECYDD